MSRRKCVVCKRELERYVPIEAKYIDNSISIKSELLNKEEYSCPYCYSPDRDRMIVGLIEMIHSRLKKGINFLEIAPSEALKRYLYKYWGESNLYTADLFMDGVDFQVDIQDMSIISNESFDFVVCSHVLEHVENDTKAMQELCRVLKKDGLGVIIVPLDLARESTDEQWGLSPEENLRRFGQEDHVRAYSKSEYIKRLLQSGFGVHQLDKQFFGEDFFEKNALTDTSVIYLVFKDESMYGDKGNVIEKFCSRNDLVNLCNYWIDVCDIYEGKLRIWGWAYFTKQNSCFTKMKFILHGVKTYTFGADMRKRDDIQNLFGESGHNYIYSGIDILWDIEDIQKGRYNVSIQLCNKEKTVELIANSNLFIG